MAMKRKVAQKLAMFVELELCLFLRSISLVIAQMKCLRF